MNASIRRLAPASLFAMGSTLLLTCGGGDGASSQSRGAGPGGAVNRDGSHGPFATLRRTQANKSRQRGMNAVAFHKGDGYDLRVSR